ncbi:MAG: NAD(+) diphosphatase [Solirubrobacteraceae bacterium]|nr:NAD(+) diphosphatase [Solirubrobacteraceae bacterium]
MPGPDLPPSPTALTGADVDRVADRRRRDEAWLAVQLASPSARAIVLGDAGVRADGGRVARIPLGDLDELIGDAAPPLGSGSAAAFGASDAAGISAAPLVFLGLDAEGPLFAVDEAPPAPGERARLVGAGGMRGEAPPEADGRIGLRVAAQTLSQADGGLVAYAAGLLNWHRTHRFCGTCGGPTTPREGGMVRRCAVCGSSLHPRTDPVVIMLVTDGAERVLLGRQAVWPARRYSTLAGFVSHGESLEEAVAREVMEEVGVQVGQAVYAASQPWPFPHSLMLGFHVPWTGGEIGAGDEELEHAAWFSRAEVLEAVQEDGWDAPGDGTGLLLPPRLAIARILVESWVRETA